MLHSSKDCYKVIYGILVYENEIKWISHLKGIQSSNLRFTAMCVYNFLHPNYSLTSSLGPVPYRMCIWFWPKDYCDSPILIHLVVSFPYLPELVLHRCTPPQLMYGLWSQCLPHPSAASLYSLPGTSSASCLMTHVSWVMVITGTAWIAIAKRCSHVILHFMTTLFSDGNPSPSCNRNSRTTWIFLKKNMGKEAMWSLDLETFILPVNQLSSPINTQILTHTQTHTHRIHCCK